MKSIKAICSYILMIVLALSIFAFVIIHLASSYVLDEGYILDKLSEENYYDEIYENVKSNFEKYIYQSGLNEDILDDIVSKEKVTKDTKIILSNIYDGLEEEVEVQTIKDNLNEEIAKALGGSIPDSQKKQIDQYITTICNEYKTTIISTKYESKINSYLVKANKYIDIANKILLIVIGISVILLCLLTIKRIYRVLAKFGGAFTISGLTLVFTKLYIYKKVKIEGITIINEPFSKVLRAILIQIFETMTKYGYILVISGILLIILYGFIKALRKYRREKEKYTPED